MKLSFKLLLILLCLQYAKGQTIDEFQNDSIKSHQLFKKTVIPLTLVGTGLIINNSNFEKELAIKIRNQVGSDYHSAIDDYLQYVPIAEMYTADLLGVKAKNHWFDQTKNLFFSNLISSTITHNLKRWTGKTRPDGSDNLSFPSGHTTFAFTNASVLFNEFKDSSPILAYSGFAFSTTTGTFRMINNKHWLSDVLVGAGIGILSTKLVYWIEPLKKFNPFKKTKNVAFYPIMGEKYNGFYLVSTF